MKESQKKVHVRAEYDRHHYLVSHLNGIACLPKDQWLSTALKIPKLQSMREFQDDEIRKAIEAYEDDMLIQRYRYGRSVQPKGKLSDLAPVVGAVKMEYITRNFHKEDFQKHAFNYSRKHLSDLILASIVTSDLSAFKMIQKLSSEEIASHRNYLIWEAIHCCVIERAEIIDMTLSGSRIKMVNLPETKDVKDFVEKHRNNPMFYALAGLDDPGWSRVFKESGADIILRKSHKQKIRKQ